MNYDNPEAIITQLLVTIGKLNAGYTPEDDLWTDLDRQAVEWANGASPQCKLVNVGGTVILKQDAFMYERFKVTK